MLLAVVPDVVVTGRDDVVIVVIVVVVLVLVPVAVTVVAVVSLFFYNLIVFFFLLSFVDRNLPSSNMKILFYRMFGKLAVYDISSQAIVLFPNPIKSTHVIFIVNLPFLRKVFFFTFCFCFPNFSGSSRFISLSSIIFLRKNCSFKMGTTNPSRSLIFLFLPLIEEKGTSYVRVCVYNNI